MGKFILITRPIEDAQEMKENLQAKGYKVFIEPLLKIVPYEVQVPNLKKYTGLIFTSRNAVRVFGKLSNERDMPIYVVGENSAKLAKEIGFTQVESECKTVQSLLDSLTVGHYWHGRGQNITNFVKGAFEANNEIKIDEKILYHAEKSGKLSNDCLKYMENEGFSDVLFFSTRTAEAFIALYRGYIEAGGSLEGLKGTKALCLSTSMVECLSEIEWQDIAVADKPDRQSLLALL
jgi:uroporphyrinogen-III synthase